MYHTAGAAVCFGNVLTEGLSLVARRQVTSWYDGDSYGDDNSNGDSDNGNGGGE